VSIAGILIVYSADPRVAVYSLVVPHTSCTKGQEPMVMLVSTEDPIPVQVKELMLGFPVPFKSGLQAASAQQFIFLVVAPEVLEG